MKKILLVLASTLGLLCAPAFALASDTPISLTASVGSLKYDAKEFSAAGAVINHETGRLPFLKLGLRYKLSEAYFVDASWRYADQKIRYDGFTQIGIPITTQTQLAWHQASVNLGYRQRWSEQQQLEWSVGLGQRRLDRDIKPTLGSLPLRETLSTSQFNLTAQWRQQINARSQWHAGITLQPSLRQSLKVDSYGLFDPITLKSAKTTDSRLFAGLSYALSEQWHLSSEIAWERIKPGASSTELWRKNGVPSATVRYPGSRQQALGLQLQITAQF